MMNQKKQNISRALQMSAFILAALAVHVWIATQFTFVGLGIIIIRLYLQ